MRKLLFLILLMPFFFSCEKGSSILIEIIEIDGASVIAEGLDYQYTCNIHPKNIDNNNIHWSVSDQTLLMVSDSGKVVALKEGKAILYAEATDGSNIKAELSITIVGKPKVNITFSNDSKFYKAVFSITSENLDFSEGFTNKILIGKNSDLTLESALYTFELVKETANNDFEIFDLTPDSTYYIRTFNTNHPDGSEYSPELEFTMPSINFASINNSSINMSLGGGYVKVIDEYIFYMNWNNNGKLYRYNTITNENIRILDYEWVFSIHQYRNYLILGISGNIVKCRFDGSEIEILKDENTGEKISSWDAFVIKDDILYLSNHEKGNLLGKYNLSTKEYATISTWAFCITLKDNFLYYKNWLSEDIYDIKRTNINNNQTEVLLTYNPSGFLSRLMAYGNSVYFYTTGGLLGRFSIENASDLSFYNASVNSFIINDNFIYYLNKNDNYNLYKMDLSESVNIKLSDMPAKSWISIINDKIFFYGNSDKNLYSINIDGTDEKLVIQ